jgi:prepilin-type N-terminal cleavage/methylation domain-containing protein
MRKTQQGMTLIELLIALTILVIGMGGVMIMIATAIAQNNGTKHDSTATMLAQMVTEQILSVPANLNPPVGGAVNPVETDCAGVAHPIPVAGAAGPLGAGALLVPQPAPAGRVAGDIDITQAFAAVPVDGTGARYAMQWVACGDAGRQPTYDVRWNVQTLSINTKLVTVAARRRDTGRTAIGFNVPVTLRTIGGL